MLKHMQSVEQFWQLWDEGNAMSGKNVTAEQRAQGHNRKRFYEWYQAAMEIGRMAERIPGDQSAAALMVCKRLDRERASQRKPKAMASYLKELGKKKQKQDV